MDLITSLTSQVLGKAMDGAAKRHQVIASNLANVDTPNYHRRDVTFEGALQSAINKAKGMDDSSRQANNDAPLPMTANRAGHYALGQVASGLDDFEADTQEVDGYQYRQDGNSVDVDSEMAQLAKNTQRYLAFSNLEGRNMKAIRGVINGGGG